MGRLIPEDVSSILKDLTNQRGHQENETPGKSLHLTCARQELIEELGRSPHLYHGELLGHQTAQHA